MSKPLIIFDMDGVLVEVTESYRETIRWTVRYFTGRSVSHEEIQNYKNEGIWNDDWKLSHHIISKAGVKVTPEEVVRHFQMLLHGRNGQSGLMLREAWVPKSGLLERLALRFHLAIFTGRMKWEAELTLKRYSSVRFDPIIGMEDVTNSKPAPEGLLKLLNQFPGSPVFYVGDTVADARCARAAGVPFIGIASSVNSQHADTVRLFQEEKAVAILKDINHLETVLNP